MANEVQPASLPSLPSPRLAIIQCSHFHTRLYTDALAGYQVVGVSDSDVSKAEATAQQLSATAYGSYQEMLKAENPELVFAFGTHAEMPSIARHLVDHRIPFAMEKPIATTYEPVAELAHDAERAGLFTAVPFVNRYSDWVKKVKELEGDDPNFTLMSFRALGTPIQRYLDLENPWLLDRSQSGGGALINFGTHSVDLISHLSGETPKRVFAVTRNAINQLSIEDFCHCVIECDGGAVAIVETGYLAPYAGAGQAGSTLLRSAKYQYVVTPAGLCWSTDTGESGQGAFSRDIVPLYGTFVHDTVAAFVEGRPPIASLRDAAQVMQVVEAAYTSASTGTPVDL